MDRMMASPLITTLGGTCCRPSALRNRLNTTTIFVNEVTITATNGASARPTTVTRMTPGLRLPKSIYLQRKQLHSHHVSYCHQLAMTDTGSVGPNDDTQLLEAAGQLEHITRLERGQFAERHRESAEIEIQAHRNVVRRARRFGVRHD